jgi:two-component system, chemotaxis family, chemotaxis protein CheY
MPMEQSPVQLDVEGGASSPEQPAAGCGSFRPQREALVVYVAAMSVAAQATVMVVEDDPDIRDSLATGLSNEGYDVIAAVNGRDALDRLELQAQPEVILLDLMMPVLNGFDFLVEIRKHPRWALIPVIVTSANRGYDEGDLGTFAVLRKPLNLDLLLDLVRGAIEQGGAPPASAAS